MRGPHEGHKDARPVTDVAAPVNTRHHHTHTDTEDKLEPKARQE